jgi:hypothetical protein
MSLHFSLSEIWLISKSISYLMKNCSIFTGSLLLKAELFPWDP